MARAKLATVIAEVVNVLCPECGEPQPNPDNGADNWKAEEVRAEAGKARSCVSCDQPFQLQMVNRVGFGV